jgi:hypothetical protein
MVPIDMLPLPDKILHMKINVEGFEGFAMQGAKETLKGVKYLTLEFSPGRYERLKCVGYEFVDAIVNMGFTIVNHFNPGYISRRGRRGTARCQCQTFTLSACEETQMSSENAAITLS